MSRSFSQRQRKILEIVSGNTCASCGKNLKKACELGIKYVNSAVLTNPNYGKGHGPINHLNSINLKKNFN